MIDFSGAFGAVSILLKLSDAVYRILTAFSQKLPIEPLTPFLMLISSESSFLLETLRSNLRCEFYRYCVVHVEQHPKGVVQIPLPRTKLESELERWTLESLTCPCEFMVRSVPSATTILSGHRNAKKIGCV